MHHFPDYVRVTFNGYEESFEPAVQRVEMERGPAKQSIINSRVIMQVSATLMFESRRDIERFEDWYFDTIQRVGYFQWQHPRLGRAITARFVGGQIGRLVPTGPAFDTGQRTVTIEYQR
ncbi:MAG: hypothetical protein Q4G62_11175 [Pseudomonadota bacterium]|nr:hypothetical protein [Pseudomonadota bacterium]